eukprot:1245117-Pyramimonas_sp.AAC.1
MARDDPGRAGGRADMDYAPELQKLVGAAAVASVARGARTNYGVAWRQWATFCRIRRRSPILRGERRGIRTRRSCCYSWCT